MSDVNVEAISKLWKLHIGRTATAIVFNRFWHLCLSIVSRKWMFTTISCNRHSIKSILFLCWSIPFESDYPHIKRYEEREWDEAVILFASSICTGAGVRRAFPFLCSVQPNHFLHTIPLNWIRLAFFFPPFRWVSEWVFVGWPLFVFHLYIIAKRERESYSIYFIWSPWGIWNNANHLQQHSVWWTIIISIIILSWELNYPFRTSTALLRFFVVFRIDNRIDSAGKEIPSHILPSYGQNQNTFSPPYKQNHSAHRIERAYTKLKKTLRYKWISIFFCCCCCCWFCV